MRIIVSFLLPEGEGEAPTGSACNLVLGSRSRHTQCVGEYTHRSTSQGAGGLQPPNSGKTIIFRAKAKFFGQKPAAKNLKKML